MTMPRAITRRAAAAAALLAATALLLGGCSDSPSAADDTVIPTPELTRDFSDRHQEPRWILSRDLQFKLSADQKAQLDAMQKQLDVDRTAKASEVRAAYGRFQRDSKTHDPSAAALIGDLQALSEAQLALTTAIVDGALKGYAVLRPDQKKTFDDLSACCGKA